MRYDTFTAVAEFVTQSQDAGIIRHFYEDGDLMYFSLKTGERIMGYLIERAFTLQNLQHHISTNTAKGRYSLFFFREDAFLPAHGDLYLIEDWMQALLAVQGDKIYAFDVRGKHVYFFPVHFLGTGRYRHIEYGDLIEIANLHGETVETDEPLLAGKWRMATFDAREAHEQPKRDAIIEVNPQLAPYYGTLGIPHGEGMVAIKRAYRSLARQYHPDLNSHPEAIARMKQINEAYQRLVGYWGE
jgi:hypothetical protein